MFIKRFARRKLDYFKVWRSSPVKKSERVLAGVMSVWGGLWVGGLGSLIIGGAPVAGNIVIASALSSSLMFLLLSLRFPKLMICVSFPFCFFSFGGVS